MKYYYLKQSDIVGVNAREKALTTMIDLQKQYKIKLNANEINLINSELDIIQKINQLTEKANGKAIFMPKNLYSFAINCLQWQKNCEIKED